jgi:hypothetical protein
MKYTKRRLNGSIYGPRPGLEGYGEGVAQSGPLPQVWSHSTAASHIPLVIVYTFIIHLLTTVHGYTASVENH